LSPSTAAQEERVKIRARRVNFLITCPFLKFLL